MGDVTEGHASEGSTTDHRRPRHRTALVVGLLTVALYIVGLVVVGIRDALSAMADASHGRLLLALLLAALGVVALAMVHRASAAAVRHVLRVPEALNVSMTAFTIGQAVPGGSAVAGAVVVQRLTRFGLSGPVATASLALSMTLSAATIAVIGALGVGVAVVRGEVASVLLAVAILVLLVVLGLVAVVLTVIRSSRIGDRVISAVSRIHPKLGDRCERWLSNFARLNANPPSARSLLRVVCWSSVKWLGDLAALGLVFAAYGVSVTVTAVLLGFVVSQLASAIPVTPGGVGFVEGGMLSVFVALGVALSVATVVVVTYRVLVTWLPTAAGVPGLVWPPQDRSA